MSSRPEDRPKIIALIAVIACVLGIVLFTTITRLLAAQSGAPQAGTPAAPLTTASATGTGSGTPQNLGGASAPLPDDENDPAAPTSEHDSFTPPAGADLLSATPAPVAKPGPAAAPTPPAFAKPAGFGPGMPPPGSVSVVPVAPPLPMVELKGVILGDPALAVLSVNNEIMEKQVGDRITGDLKLIKITDAGILLTDGKKKFPVAVGHGMPSTAPQAMPATPSDVAAVTNKP
jgi:hypothetical protein